MNVILILLRELIDQEVNDVGVLFFEDLDHVLLLDGQLWLRLLIAFEVAAFTAIPSFSLALWLDLNLQKLDEEHSK